MEPAAARDEEKLGAFPGIAARLWWGRRPTFLLFCVAASQADTTAAKENDRIRHDRQWLVKEPAA
jgi:hypothetical protein